MCRGFSPKAGSMHPSILTPWVTAWRHPPAEHLSGTVLATPNQRKNESFRLYSALLASDSAGSCCAGRACPQPCAGGAAPAPRTQPSAPSSITSAPRQPTPKVPASAPGGFHPSGCFQKPTEGSARPCLHSEGAQPELGVARSKRAH